MLAGRQRCLSSRRVTLSSRPAASPVPRGPLGCIRAADAARPAHGRTSHRPPMVDRATQEADASSRWRSAPTSDLQCSVTGLIVSDRDRSYTIVAGDVHTDKQESQTVQRRATPGEPVELSKHEAAYRKIRE